MGSAPDDMKGSAALQYELDKMHGEKIKHNIEKWRAKAGKLRDAGAFRIPRPRDTWERVDAPRFLGEVFNVDDSKERMSTLVTRPTQLKHPLQCLLEALMLILVLKQSEKCSRTSLET